MATRGLQQFLMWDPGAKESLPCLTDKTPTDPHHPGPAPLATEHMPPSKLGAWPREHCGLGSRPTQAWGVPPTCTFGFSSQRGVG